MSKLTDKVNLLSYNFFLRPPGINNNGCDFKEDRLNFFCSDHLSFYDVICFQEVFAFGSTRRKRLIDCAKKLGLPYYKASKRPCFFTGIDGGLLILSRFPIVRSSDITFKTAVHSDVLSHKGALYAKINIRDNFHIHVFNTHTQASYASSPSLEDKSVQTRLEQLIELRKFVDETLVSKSPGEPVFLLGDFNVNSRLPGHENDNLSSPEYQAMIQILCEGRHKVERSINAERGLSFKAFKDLLFEKHGYHPITYADIESRESDLPRETVLTCKSDLKSTQSLDYIFQLEENLLSDKTEVGIYRAEVHTAHVDCLFTDSSINHPCTQLSDHYGVTAQVLIYQL